MIGIALKTLGYSLNSEKPEELEAVLQRLLELKSNTFFIDLNLPHAADSLASGEAVMVYGWPYDALEGRARNEAIIYVTPEEGAILWTENLVIPANSPNKEAAELFINYILRPEISAQIINEIYTPVPNEAAKPFIKPDILNDPVIFPPEEMFKNAELILPLSSEGERLYGEVWKQFMAVK